MSARSWGRAAVFFGSEKFGFSEVATDDEILNLFLV